MAVVKLLAFAAVAAVAQAACPNQCSGHGTCSSNDICTCYQNWQGPDCSLRTCSFGNSWALDNEDPHAYEECSGAGLCDRASGECKCFSGFSGYACQRRACPNDCSGHGLCRLLKELKTVVPYSADKWDADHIQACVCDAGFFGTDCSQRRCPTGDDPLTLCDDAHKGMVQQIKVTLGSKVDYWPVNQGHLPLYTQGDLDEGMDMFGTGGFGTDPVKTFWDIQESADYAQLRIGATDSTGQVYYAPASAKAVFAKDNYLRQAQGITTVDPGLDSIETALENIAAFKVRNVQVTGRFTSATPGHGNGLDNVIQKRYLVTFVPFEQSSANYGVQNALVCDSGYGCSNPGCQPVVKMAFLYRYAATTAEQSSIDTSPVAPNPATFAFYTGLNNVQAKFDAKSFIRLSSDSMPRLPPGVPVDTGVSAANTGRYDIRVVVAVQDPADPTNADSSTDVYWTKVVYTNTNITTDVFELKAGTTYAGVFSDSKKMDFMGTLNGFTYRGFIPGTKKASVPDAPGVILQFPSQNMISTDQYYKFYEILIKLPSCEVTSLLTGSEFKDVADAALTPVSTQVENVECSNRGQCNRDTGLCECFEGYYGVACHRQTVLV